VLNFFEWFINYANGKFVYSVSSNGFEECSVGPTNHLAVVKNNWSHYPKQIWKAYDAYTKASKN
jgi:hypothetical protein